ncbi:MAG TPA: GNAT family N-acetyltransferase [Blastocatellia bacterium]|nr:GNAT family N-acetyltransferase [Blastocatellia bacterium]
MFQWEVNGKRFQIREAESESEYHAIEEIQRVAWGFSDLDIVPAATLIATEHAGGIVLGAFDGDRMIGFAYGFPAFEEGRTSMHSHMLAVRPEYRNAQVGFNLKLAQREATIAKGLDEISWTFDPLQSLNAHLNFAKLGVVSRRYIVNFYGEATSSPLHQGFGTDRLWVRWLVTSERVTNRLRHDESYKPKTLTPDSLYAAALVTGEGELPHLADNLSERLSSDKCLIEIPHNINAIKERDPQAGRNWREATRAAFLAAIEAGFAVEDFLKVDAQNGPRWFYLLAR